MLVPRMVKIVPILGLPPTQDSSQEWRFRGIPGPLQWNSSGGDCYWVGGSSKLYYFKRRMSPIPGQSKASKFLPDSHRLHDRVAAFCRSTSKAQNRS